MANKKIVKSWDEIKEDFAYYDSFSCKPSISQFQKHKNGYVFDEEKSVRWNKEEVEKKNKEYENEVARLNKEKNRLRDDVYENIYNAIQREVGHGIDRKKAEKIWGMAWDYGHNAGFGKIMTYLNEFMDFARNMLE